MDEQVEVKTGDLIKAWKALESVRRTLNKTINIQDTGKRQKKLDRITPPALFRGISEAWASLAKIMYTRRTIGSDQTSKIVHESVITKAKEEGIEVEEAEGGLDFNVRRRDVVVVYNQKSGQMRLSIKPGTKIQRPEAFERREKPDE